METIDIRQRGLSLPNGSSGRAVLAAETQQAALQAIGLLQPSGDGLAGVALAMMRGRIQSYHNFTGWAAAGLGGQTAPVVTAPRWVDLQTSTTANRSQYIAMSGNNGWGTGMGQLLRNQIDWSKPWKFSVTISRQGISTNGYFISYLGAPINVAPPSSGNALSVPTFASAGFRVNQGTAYGWTHNGSDYELSGVIANINGSETFDLMAVGDGSGRVDFYANSSAIPVTLLNGPTGLGPANHCGAMAGVSNAADATNVRWPLHHVGIFTQ